MWLVFYVRTTGTGHEDSGICMWIFPEKGSVFSSGWGNACRAWSESKGSYMT